ncbi:MAG: hypothetical protein JST06_04200 [Bacteroidetes bacterium]|nr:hypothetical protein [Bacteroidota bacterium]MBS1628935.1 hypothetical protein [Bacteroidota bacterium]
MSARIVSFSGIATVVLLAWTGVQTDAQVSATSGVNANIITPVSISQASSQLELRSHPLQFQNLAASNVVQRRVSRMKQDDEDVRAQFEISGSPEYAFSITVPRFISVEHRENVLTLETKTTILTGTKKLSGTGTAMIEVEGIVVTTNLPKRNLALAYNEEEERYEQNSLPILISYN